MMSGGSRRGYKYFMYHEDGCDLVLELAQNMQEKNYRARRRIQSSVRRKDKEITLYSHRIINYWLG